MRKTMIFATRTLKEILRDPLSIAFGVGFPVVLIILLSVINQNIPNDKFNIQLLSPGVAVFGLSFLALFAAQMISKDRDSAYTIRLFTTPMKAWDFILGYTLPLVPLAILQGFICYLTGLVFGLQINIDAIISLFSLIPTALIFIGIGLLCGTLLSEKAATALCGALLTNLSAWLSGVWFDLDLVGGVFKTIANALPFVHAVKLTQTVSTGQFSQALPQLWWVLAYAMILIACGVYAFQRHMLNR